MADFWRGFGEGAARSYESARDRAIRAAELKKQRKIRAAERAEDKEEREEKERRDEEKKAAGLRAALALSSGKSWNLIKGTPRKVEWDEVSRRPVDQGGMPSPLFGGEETAWERDITEEQSIEDVLKRKKLHELTAYAKATEAAKTAHLKMRERQEDAHKGYIGVGGDLLDAYSQSPAAWGRLAYLKGEGQKDKATRLESALTNAELLGREGNEEGFNALALNFEGLDAELLRDKFSMGRRKLPVEISEAGEKAKAAAGVDEGIAEAKETKDRDKLFERYSPDIKKAYSRARGGDWGGSPSHIAFNSEATADDYLEGLKELGNLQDRYDRLIKAKKGVNLGYAELGHKDDSYADPEFIKGAIGRMNGMDDEILKAHLAEQRKAPYKYVDIKTADDVFHYRTWRINAGEEDRMNPNTQEGENWINRANEGLKIEAGMFSDGKPIRIRVKNISDLRKAYGQGGKDVKEEAERLEEESKPTVYEGVKPAANQKPTPATTIDPLDQPIKGRDPAVHPADVKKTPEAEESYPVRRGLPYGEEVDPDVPPVRRGLPYGRVVESETKTAADYIESLSTPRERSLFIDALQESQKGPIPEHQQKLLDDYYSWLNNWRRSTEE